MNTNEQRLYDGLTAKGVTVLRRGWPDFLIVDEKRQMGCALELKVGKDRVSSEQTAMHSALALFGLPTFIVREDFLSALNKRGRKLALPKTIEGLEREANVLRTDLAAARRRLDRVERELEAATILFEPAPGTRAHRATPAEEFATDRTAGAVNLGSLLAPASHRVAS